MNNRIAVAISGGGRTLRNLISQQADQKYAVAAVISSSPSCPGNEIAKEFNLPIFVGAFSPKHFDKTQRDLQAWLNELDIRWIALGGFLKIFPTYPEFHRRIVNIHPALLPKYGGKGMYGLNVHKAVFEANEDSSGPTIHYVTEQYDEGQIIAQKAVDISECKSPEEIAARVFIAECELYPQTLSQLMERNNE